MVTRTIVIKPGTSYVNVTSGEVIRFEVGNQSFIWNFNGIRTSFDLAQVAPPAVLDRKVTAYVAPNPSLRRR
jgi:Heavy-metal resistance protein CzcE